MKKIITLLVGIVFWGSGFSQSTFQNMYFNNYLSNGKYLTLGTDGNIVIAGEYITLSMNYWNLFIYKLNNTGDTLWTKLIGDTTGQGPEDILTTSDGGYFITGITKGNTPLLADVLALKLDSSGNVVWVKSIGGVAADVGSGACTTSDGGFCIAGSCSGATPDAYLVRLDGNGNLLWAKSYRELGNSSETFRDVRQT
ncbi:MAG TPA: hypothetical protein VI757_09340, partial [Bacteroidia bacterium]|nr:hypothetical protein [Bacteroidia bacterium]